MRSTSIEGDGPSRWDLPGSPQQFLGGDGDGPRYVGLVILVPAAHVDEDGRAPIELRFGLFLPDPGCPDRIQLSPHLCTSRQATNRPRRRIRPCNAFMLPSRPRTGGRDGRGRGGIESVVYRFSASRTALANRSMETGFRRYVPAPICWASRTLSVSAKPDSTNAFWPGRIADSRR
jgi:hypothetical protein